jgi:AraC-like DNA-binding protein
VGQAHDAVVDPKTSRLTPASLPVSSILILHACPVARDRIRRALALDGALHVRHTPHWVSCWKDLSDAAASIPSGLAIVDPFHSPRPGQGLAMFTQRFQSIDVIAYGDFSDRPAADVVDLVRFGVSTVLTWGVDDDPPSIARVLLQAGSQRWFRPVLRVFAERYGPPVVRILEQLVHAAVEPLTPDALAARLGQNRRTLERFLSTHRLPAPAALFTWFRLLHATRLLEDPARRIESVACSLGFGSGAALSSAFKRYTGRSPREILKRGGVDHLTAIMLCEFQSPNPSVSSASVPHSERSHLA